MTESEQPLEVGSIEFNPMRTPLEALVDRMKKKAGSLEARGRRKRAIETWEIVNELEDILGGREE